MKLEEGFECWGHKKTRLKYHIVLVTKYRYKCLKGIESDVYDALKRVENISDIRINHIGIESDHIHLIVTIPPKYSISQIENKIKQSTLNYLYAHQNDHLRKFYRRRKRKLWSDGCFVGTIGLVSEQKVSSYLEHHDWYL